MPVLNTFLSLFYHLFLFPFKNYRHFAKYLTSTCREGDKQQTDNDKSNPNLENKIGLTESSKTSDIVLGIKIPRDIHKEEHTHKKRTPIAIITTKMSTKTYSKISRTLDTGRKGWEGRFANVPEVFLEFEKESTSSSGYPPENEPEYLQDVNIESWYNDFDDHDRMELIRDHNDFLARNN